MTNERGSCLTKRLGAEGMPELTAKRIPGRRCCPLTHANRGMWHPRPDARMGKEPPLNKGVGGNSCTDFNSSLFRNEKPGLCERSLCLS